jgi:hypothetical protein
MARVSGEPGEPAEQGDVERARAAKDRAAQRLRRLPNVSGLGVGYKIVAGERTSTVCVRVYVRKKVPETALSTSEVVPKDLNGVPTDVIEDTFKIHTLPIAEHRRWRAFLYGGISIGNAITGGSGTLATAVFDAKTGEPLLLSNWHVLCGRTDCVQGEAIIQPGTGGGDTGRAGDVVARLVRSSLTDVVDAAVARITGQRMLFEDILQIGPASGTASAVLGEWAQKSGRTTGYTTGQVADVDADIDVDYSELGLGIRHYEHQVVIEGDDASAPGDSGSAWLNDRSEIIALNFAGNDAHSRADANPIAPVVGDLQIVIGAGVPLHDYLLVAGG